MSPLGAAVSLGPRKRPWHLRPLPTRAAGPNHVLLLSPKSHRAHASRHSQQKEMPLDQLHGYNGLAPIQDGPLKALPSCCQPPCSSSLAEQPAGP